MKGERSSGTILIFMNFMSFMVEKSSVAVAKRRGFGRGTRSNHEGHEEHEGGAAGAALRIFMSFMPFMVTLS